MQTSSWKEAVGKSSSQASWGMKQNTGLVWLVWGLLKTTESSLTSADSESVLALLSQGIL